MWFFVYLIPGRIGIGIWNFETIEAGRAVRWIIVLIYPTYQIKMSHSVNVLTVKGCEHQTSV